MHWGKLVWNMLLLGTDYRKQNSSVSVYDFLRPAAENTSLVKFDLPSTYASSLLMKDDGTLLYDDRDSYWNEICVNDVEVGVLKRAPLPPLIKNLASLFGIPYSTADEQCASGHLLSTYHYHRGSQGVTNKDFSIKMTHNLFVSDASVKTATATVLPQPIFI